jgi:hypothetical protein
MRRQPTLISPPKEDYPLAPSIGGAADLVPARSTLPYQSDQPPRIGYLPKFANSLDNQACVPSPCQLAHDVSTPLLLVHIHSTIRHVNGDIEHTILDNILSLQMTEMAVIPEDRLESVGRPPRIPSGVLGSHRSHSWAPTWVSESQWSPQVGVRVQDADAESIRSQTRNEPSSIPSTKLGQYPRSLLLIVANRDDKCCFACRRPSLRICREPNAGSYQRLSSQCSSPLFTVSSGSSEAGDSGHGAHGDRLAQSSSCPRR